MNPRPPSVRFVALVAGSITLVACGGHGKDAADRQLDEMRAQIAKVQADTDRFAERIVALEASHDARREDPAPKAAPGGVEMRPRLRVVRVRPNGETVEEDVAEGDGDVDDQPRPVIRATGKAGAALSDGAEKPSAASPEAKHEYENALSLVKGKKYEKAIEAFAGFLVRYPDHPHADNAMYWRGECFYAKGDYAHAVEQFDGLIARFSQGNKVPDALLKLGLSHQKMGAQDKARAAFARLLADYPKSDAARQAPHE